MGVKLGNGKWAIKEDKLLAYNDNSGRFFNKEFDFSRGSSATYVAKDGLIKTAGLQATNLVNNPSFSELGSELILNGNFDTDSDWIKNAGATISNGRGNIIGDGTSFTNLSQSNVFTVGKFYKVTLDAVINSGLGLKVQDVSTNENFGAITTSGTYTFYGKANNSTLTIGRRTGGIAFDSYIDNVSVKQVDPNDYWTITNNTGTDTIIKDGYAEIKTDGAFTQIAQSNILSIGKTYKLKYNVIQSDNGNLGLEIGGSTTLINSTVGTHTFIWTSNSSDLVLKRYSGVLDISITNISVQEIQTDTPRIDFSDSVKGALLLEPSSTQLIQYSEDFSQSVWIKTGSTSVSSNDTISPDGTQNASTISGLTGSGTNDIYYVTGINPANNTYSFSAYLKGSGSVRLACSNNVDSGGSIVFDLTDDWVRYEIQKSFNATSGNLSVSFDDNGGTATEYKVWGAQLEQKSFATSYIPNHGVSGGVTRLADVCINSGSAQDFNSEEGVIYAEISDLVNQASVGRSICISDGTNSHRALISYSTVTNQISVFHNNGITSPVNLLYTVSDITVFHKIAFKYKLNNFSLWVDGEEIATSSSGGVNIANTFNTLEFQNASGTSDFYGKVREVQVFTEALTDEQLQKLTQV